MAKDEDDLPESVKAERDKLLAEGGEEKKDETTEEPELERVATPAAKPRSRREEREQERQERERALVESAGAAKKALEVAEELRRARQEDQERYARLEGMLMAQSKGQEQRTKEPEDDDDGGDSGAERILKAKEKREKHMKAATEALAAGNLDEYHSRLAKADAVMRKAEGRNIEKSLEKKLEKRLASQAQQQQPGKPAWVTNVESQFPDVVGHQKGLQTVVGFMHVDGGQPNAETLTKAFKRAQKELGLKGKDDNEQKRQMLSGGRVNGGGGRTSGGNVQGYVNLPKNWREIARGAGMSADDYIRNYAESNPGEVSRE